MVILYRVGDPPVLPSKAMDSSSEWVCKITKPTVQGVDEPPSMTLCYTKAVSSPPQGFSSTCLALQLDREEG